MRLKIFLLLSLALLLTGCFHLRSPKDFPASLKHLTVTSDNVYREITVSLERRLKGSGVTLTPSTQKNITLLLRNSRYDTDVPIIFDSLQATAYTYRISLQLKILNKHGKVLYNQNLAASEIITHNVNQINAAVFTPLMRRRLAEQLVDTIYNILISTSIVQEATQP